eukprot:jgi/Psemu1/49476/gm1.49476_g
MSDSDLKLLFPSFDLKLAHILHATLDIPQEPCNHICETLIIAGATTWTRFVCEIYEYGYIVDLEYQAQTGPRSISIKDQHTFTTFVDLINHIIPQAGHHWYDHNQYTRDVFLAFCNARNQYPELAAKPCLTQPVLTTASSLVSVSVTPPARVLATPPARVSETTLALASSTTSVSSTSTCATPVIYTDLPASTVRFRRIISSSIPLVHSGTPPGDAFHTTNRERHSPRLSSKPSANPRWTFHPKSATVTFHRSPKKNSSHKLSTSIPSLQLPPSRTCSKDRVIPSSGPAIVPSSGHAYPQHGASSCPGWKPIYGAHSLIYNSPAVCITKQHCDAIKLKLYRLHATFLVANWTYDDIV